ncbi:MAG TPA: CcmD family protein [Polyangiaceae bacterium]|nr:CcmD family protein [Polyangiaceae bacterium]HMR78009.1 CcmD family protein [Polyangiaceae bacterium]
MSNLWKVTQTESMGSWLGLQPRLELAQVPANSANPEERATEFVPVEGGRESTSAEALLIVAYCILWVVLFWFVFSTWKRQGQLETRLADLDRRLARARDDAPES